MGRTPYPARPRHLVPEIIVYRSTPEGRFRILLERAHAPDGVIGQDTFLQIYFPGHVARCKNQHAIVHTVLQISGSLGHTGKEISLTQLQLLFRHFIARRQQTGRCLRISIQVQEIFISVIRNFRQVQTDVFLPVGKQIHRESARRGLLPVPAYFPSESIVFQVGKVVAVPHGNPPVRDVLSFKLDVLVHFFHFPSLRLRRTVGRKNTVRTCIPLARLVFEPFVASHFPVVHPINPAVPGFRLHSETLVLKIPDETALKVGTVVNDIPYILEISVAIALRMSVFAHDERTLFAGLPVVLDSSHIGIHQTDHIRIPILPRLFKLHKA